MAYTDNWTTVNHAFLISHEYTAEEKLILIWLASKPDDWDVRTEQVQQELHLGRDAVKRILHHLRDKGAITKPLPERQPNGKWCKTSGRLAIRSEIRPVSAGGTGVRETQFPSSRPINKEGNNKEGNNITGAAEAAPTGSDSLVPSRTPESSPRCNSSPDDLATTPRSFSPVLTLEELVRGNHNTMGFYCLVCGTRWCRENERRIRAEFKAERVSQAS
jgi:hypothetical protein